MFRQDTLINFCLLAGFCFGMVFGQSAQPKMYEIETTLKKDLFDNYDRTVPPNPDNKTSTEVQLGIGLVDIESLDEIREIMTTHIWLRIFWTDERLSFNSSKYGGAKAIAVPYDKVWRPDIVPYSLAQDEFKYSSDYQAIVFHNGGVLFVPHTRLQTRCSLDFTRYPFDEQSCQLKFGSWVYDSNTLNLKSYASGFDTDDYIHNNKWRLVNTSYTIDTKYYPCCEEAYQSFSATVKLRRFAKLLANMYLGPSIAIGLVIPVIFLLPQYSIYKLVLGGILLLSQLLVYNTLIESLPTTHTFVPLIVFYELANVILLLLAIVFSALVLYCSYKARDGRVGVPYIIDKVFLGILSRMCCAKKEDFINNSDPEASDDPCKASTDDSAAIMKEYTRLVAPAEWRQLAVVLDRLFFVLFAVMSIFLMSVMVRYSF